MPNTITMRINLKLKLKLTKLKSYNRYLKVKSTVYVRYNFNYYAVKFSDLAPKDLAITDAKIAFEF